MRQSAWTRRFAAGVRTVPKRLSFYRIHVAARRGYARAAAVDRGRPLWGSYACVELGGLMSYSANMDDLSGARALSDKILKGAKNAEPGAPSSFWCHLKRPSREGLRSR